MKDQNFGKEIEANLSSIPFTKAAAASIVKEFGRQLKMVPLLAPPQTYKSDMEKYYSGLVTEELLAKWQSDPKNAPGRMVSSPWPDRIEIESIEEIDDRTYKVTGHIVEVTSEEEIKGGAAHRRPITLTVSKINDHPVITDVLLTKQTK